MRAIRTIIATGQKFKGEIILEYDAVTELLIKADLTGAELNSEQHHRFLQWLPKTIAVIAELQQKKSGLIFTDKEVTFEMFWNRYDDRLNSSKKRTMAKWQKMSKAEQLKAYFYIQKYFLSIPAGTRKKYAETYLNAELWNN
ncbi:MAG: hypothetical protein LBR17_01250 [Bacteroidales bacterium]|jgi:hypothetical protein|nr:hypothetical protein [Bacteroidales bacterium]